MVAKDWLLGVCILCFLLGASGRLLFFLRHRDQDPFTYYKTFPVWSFDRLLTTAGRALMALSLLLFGLWFLAG